MAKKKVYAVKKGMTTGLFDTWEECKASVEGYPGAEYKGFSNLAEAKTYLGIVDEESTLAAIPEGHVVAYVDGSYSQELETYSFGCILLTPNENPITYSGNGQNPDSIAIRNVAGEMIGAMFAVKWALKNGYKKLEIRYDYEGIEKWVTGEWKAKMELTQKYADYMKRCGQRIQISFGKVEAHTGDYYNEEADRLAKEALVSGNGIPQI